MDKLSLTGLDTLSTRPIPSSTVPFRRDRDFVHREILSEIQTRCSLPASRVALVGLGWVLVASARQCKLTVKAESLSLRSNTHTKSPDMWVFWVHTSSAARFEEGYS